MENLEIIYNQMDEWLTPEKLLTNEVKTENFCVGKIDGKVACAFILQNSDTEYWKDSGEAIYLHKLCVNREYAHRNMTKSVIEAIKEECRKSGIKYVRLDTGPDEKVVRKTYLNAGLKIVDIIDYDNGRSVALFELEV